MKQAGDPEPDSRGRALLARWREAAILAWWSGLAAGLTQVVILSVRRHIVGEFTWVSQDALWMTPVAYLAFFLPIALVLPIVPGPRRRVRYLWAGTFAFFGVLSLLIPFGQVAGWAAALLALGLAAQAARLYAGRPGLRARILPTAVIATVAIAAAALGQRAWRTVERSRTIAALPAPAAGAPNVLLLILDTVRGESLGLYGYDRPTTPALERHAADATVFDRAIATAPWTLPTHGTLLTGRYPAEIGGDFKVPIAPGGTSLAEVFNARGYRTAGFVANLLYTSYESGIARGFVEYRDYRASIPLVLTHSPIGQTAMVQRLLAARGPRQLLAALRGSPLAIKTLPADVPVPAPVVTDDFLAWQRGLGGRPFFAMLNYFDAHGPYRAPATFLARFKGQHRERDRYDAAIAFLDSEIDRLFGVLAQRGVLEHTIVVLVADHGELFGEHGLKGHANALFLPLLRVPLLIRYPAGVPRGRRVTTPISLRDVAATVVALAGVQGSGPPGVSLTRFWTADSSALSPILSEVTQGRNVDSTFPNARTGLRSILDDRYHFIRNGFGEELLYDWVMDSLELVNLAGNPQVAGEEGRLRRLLDSLPVRR